MYLNVFILEDRPSALKVKLTFPSDSMLCNGADFMCGSNLDQGKLNKIV